MARSLGRKARSVTRVMNGRAEVAEATADPETRRRLKQVARPNSVSRTLRNAGVALILAPDPVTVIPGAVMLGASLATRNKKPLDSGSVVVEAQKILDELRSSI